MSNRIQYFIRNILQNSKLNREKFVNNKKIYSHLISKNRQNNSNRIIIRKMTTFREPPLSFGGAPLSFGGETGGGRGPRDPKWNPFIMMFVFSMGVIIHQYITDKKK